MSDLPANGSEGRDHQDNPAIDEAARWLASLPTGHRPRPPVPALQRRFGLSPVDACAAIRASHLVLARAT